MAEQLSQYLEKKEAQVSRQILEVIVLLEGFPALEEAFSPDGLRLSEAVEEFGRKVRRAGQTQKQSVVARENWKIACRQIDQVLWTYIDVLEGCVTELFQQINQIGFEQWNVDVIRTATSIKDELTHRMDDLVWAIRRLDQQLKIYSSICDAREGKSGHLRALFQKFSSCLDSALESTVRKCNKFLHFRYRQFVERYTGYLQLYDYAEKSVQRLQDYRILSSLEIDQQDKLKQLCFLLTLWEKNSHSLILPQTEPVRAVRACLSFENALVLFREYFHTIRNAVFDQSRMIKQQFRLIFIDKAAKRPLIENLASYRAELRTLKDLVEGFRKFHIQTDPGSKHGFFSHFSFFQKQQPKELQEISRQLKEIKNLENLITHFQLSLEKDATRDRGLTPKLQNEVNKHLHEMGQPLASKDLMRRNAKALVSSLQSLDEIAAFDPQIVDFIGRTLCKAMCSDWKYHVLQEISPFHQIYETHQGFFTLSDNRLHLNRLHKFQKILDRLSRWIQNEETLKHTQEVDLDVHDIKAYLQDFLAYVQRLQPEEESVLDIERFKRPIGEAVQALLEYLHLFGSFFSRLHRDDFEHRLMRKQLLFIDQYFEAIERRIQELYR